MSLDPKYIERCRGIVKFLDNTIKNLAVYPPEHPSVKGVSQRAYDFLMEVLEGRDEILVGITNGVLNVDEYFFSEATSYSENFMKTLNAFEIDNLVITNGVTLEDVLKLAGVLGSTDRGKEAFLSLAQEQKLRHIGPRGFSLQEDDDPAAGIINIYRHAVNAVTGFFTQIREGRLPLLEDALSLVDGFLKFLPTDRDALLLLTSLKGYERYTAQHCVNVCLLAMLLAEEEGLDERDVGWAALAGLMHDTGMVKVPSNVAEKAGSLTLGERETFKSHPVHSAGILHGMGAPDEVVLAVERHHIQYGGGGYPSGLEKEQLPSLAGLVAVADTYDALTSIRPYKPPMGPVQALDFLEKGRGSRFDPRHVDGFRSMTGPCPPGTMVRLSSNEIGVVTRVGKLPGQPAVHMLVDETGTILEDPWVLDLSDDEVQGRMITGVVDPALYGLASERVFD